MKKIPNAIFSLSELGKLAAAVDYSKASIVRKTAIRRKKSELSILAFDKGQSYDYGGGVPSVETVFCLLEGEAEILSDSGAINLRAGETAILSADLPRKIVAVEPFKALNLNLNK